MSSFSNQSPVTNQALQDVNIGMLLRPSRKLYAPNVRLEHQHIYHGDKPDTLLGLAAPQAAFNARGKDEDPQCLPNTRVLVLQQIRTWADRDDGRHIFWLRGWPGTGKSTIARTIAREHYDKKCLVASFFFSRGGGDVSHAGKFVGTIASQLAQRCAAFKNFLIKAISDDKGIGKKTLKDQWNELILQPLSKLDASSFQAPLLVVVDALDECEKNSDVRQVLHLLSGLRCLKGLHCRVFVTSRPDIDIDYEFPVVSDQDYQDFVLHDISNSIVDKDIFTYLQHCLADIQRKHSLQENWPGEEAIRQLVRKAAGLFIWAATAYRFIDEGGSHSGPDRLSDILERDSSDIKPEDELNSIYTKVLDDAIGGHLKQREKLKAYNRSREALGSIVTLFSPLPAYSLTQMLRMDVGAMLGGLHSILDIPKDSTRTIRLHHPSLRDFLLSPQRCRNPNFWVDEKNTHEALANHCIRLISQKLNKKDLCGLGDPGAKAAEVPSDKIQHCLPPELQYACEYWVSHLQRSKIKVDESWVHRFLRGCCVQCLQQRRGHTNDDALAYTSFLNHWFHWLGAFGLPCEKIRFQRLPPSSQYLGHDTPVYTFSRHRWLPWLGPLGLVLDMVWFWRVQPSGHYLNHDAPVYTFSQHHWLPWLGPLGLVLGMVWFWRLQPSGQYLDDGGPVHVFMQQHFLYWLEALSLAGKISEGVRAIQLLEDMVDVRLLKAAREH